MAIETNPYLDKQYQKHPVLCAIVYIALSILCIIIGIMSWICILETWLAVMFLVGGVLGIICTVYLFIHSRRNNKKNSA